MDNYNDLTRNYNLYRNESITDWVLGFYNIEKILSPIKDKTILDYGCGTGEFSRFICDKGAMVIGVDTSEKMIEQAKNFDSSDIRYHLIKSGELNFIQSQSVDCAVLNFVLCIISSKEEIAKIIKEVGRVLKKGGQIVILNANWEKSNGKEFLCFKLCPQDHLVSGQKVKLILKAKNPIELEDYFWPKNDYTKILEDSGFSVFEIQEPTTKGDEYEWISEKEFPPFLIIVGAKQ